MSTVTGSSHEGYTKKDGDGISLKVNYNVIHNIFNSLKSEFVLKIEISNLHKNHQEYPPVEMVIFLFYFFLSFFFFLSFDF